MTPPPQPAGRRPAGEWTVKRILEWTTGHLREHGSETPRLDAELLLAHARNCPRIALYTDFDQPLDEGVRSVMRDLVKRRARHEPVAYLIGHREFFGLEIHVTSDVLVPRPETETLVLETVERAREFDGPRLLDVGTGSGCIALALAANLPEIEVVAVDSSEAALAVARDNAQGLELGERIQFLQGDLFDPVRDERPFDFVVSNPPYVTEGEFSGLQADVRDHEPRQALVAGSDGLDVVRRLVAESPQHVAPGGWLLVEIDPAQVSAVRELLAETEAFGNVQVARDANGEERVAAARRV